MLKCQSKKIQIERSYKKSDIVASQVELTSREYREYTRCLQAAGERRGLMGRKHQCNSSCNHGQRPVTRKPRRIGTHAKPNAKGDSHASH